MLKIRDNYKIWSLSNSIYFFILVFIGFVFVIIVSNTLVSKDKTIKSNTEAQGTGQIEQDSLSLLSGVQEGKEVINADLYSEDNPILVSSEDDSVSAVFDVMKKLEKIPMPETAQQRDSINEDVKGVVSTQTVLPPNFTKNSRLIRVVDENKDQKTDVLMKSKHYYFGQELAVKKENLPVYGSLARFDINGENDLVGLGISLVRDNKIVQGSNITKKIAEQIALSASADEGESDREVCKFSTVYKSIINLNLLGLSDDANNYETYAVDICNSTDPLEFHTIYYVATFDGRIVYEESKIYEVLKRIIKDCQSGQCVVSRKEGDGPVGKSEVDKSYDIIGTIYNFYKDNFGRDSFDNKGTTIKAKVAKRMKNCPNAYWLTQTGEMTACPGMVATDVWGHELTHGVTAYTANLIYKYQSGALNEGFSDIFGWGVDQDNWTLGEKTVAGVIRSISNPSSGRRPQPDRLFSKYYHCSGSDNGGVHVNSGILNKAFYLMVQGGSFNGCNVSGLGAEKSLKIMYKALTVYIRSNSNFRDTYTQIIKSCEELYGRDSLECTNVTSALQAVEMDQQAPGIQAGPLCSGGKPKTPQCAGGTSPTNSPTGTPTGEPLPTGPISPDPTVSQIPGEGLKEIKFKELCTSNLPKTQTDLQYKVGEYVCSDGSRGSVGDGTVCYSKERLTDMAKAVCGGQATPQPTKSISPTTILSPTNNPTEEPTPVLSSPYPTSARESITPASSERMRLDISLKFQGILKRPPYPMDAQEVRIGLVGEDFNEPIYKTATFESDNDGVWRGTVYFDAQPGQYYLLVKGPMHVQRKVCHTNPYESYAGTYKCNQNKIQLKEKINALDFSGLTMLVGDLPQQDGIVNSYDISLIRNNIGKYDDESLRLCDVNRDLACNSQDYSLLIRALSIKLDEE